MVFSLQSLSVPAVCAVEGTKPLCSATGDSDFFMRHRVIQFGFTVIGALVGALACAGGDDSDTSSVAPTDSGANSSLPGSGASVAPSNTTTGVGTTSTGGAGTTTDAASSTAATSSTGDTTTTAAPQGPTFTADVHPLLVASCTGTSSCHGDGEVFTNFASMNVDTAFANLSKLILADGRTAAQQLVFRVSSGDMPMSQQLAYQCKVDGKHDTSKPECLTADELALLEAWAAAGGPK